MTENVGANLVTFFLTTTSPTSIDSITVDAVINEEIIRKANVTDEPVEEGEQIADNVVLDPYTINMRGIITDTPYDDPLDLLNQNITGESRSKTQYEFLVDIYNNKTIFTVISGFDIYENVVFTNFTVNLNNNSGRAFEFDADFKHIVRVSPQEIKIPASRAKTTPAGNQDQVQSTVNRGNQQTTNREDLRQRSFLAAGVDVFKGQLKYSQISQVAI